MGMVLASFDQAQYECRTTTQQIGEMLFFVFNHIPRVSRLFAKLIIQNPKLALYVLDFLTSCPLFYRNNPDTIPKILELVLSVFVQFQLPKEYSDDELLDQVLGVRRRGCTSLIRLCKALSEKLFVCKTYGCSNSSGLYSASSIECTTDVH